jgi:Polysaccharide lyase
VNVRSTFAVALCLALLGLVVTADPASAPVFNHDEIEDTYTYGTWARKYTDAAGTNGAILRWEVDSTATKTYSSLASNIDRIQVRSRTSNISVGSIWVAVVVDGTELARQYIDPTTAGKTFTLRSWSVNLPSGTRHTIGIRAGSLEGTDAFLADYVELTGPGSTPPPTGDVVWTAGGEKPIDQEWASLSTDVNCGVRTYLGIVDSRITRVSSPVNTGSFAYSSTVVDGDSCYGERAEVGQGNPTRQDMLNRVFKSGEERWISFDVRPASNVPLDPGSWQLVMQLKQMGAWGSPVIEMDIENNQWIMHRTTNNPNNQWPSGFQADFPLGPAQHNVWASFTYHVKFSPDPNVGFLEIYGDLGDGRGMRLLFPMRAMSTMKINPSTGQTIDSQARFGLYRDPRISGTATAYYDGYTVATTRAAAEAGN